jgi:hypothetical protein
VTKDILGNLMQPDYYVIYRDTQPYFTPGPAKALASTADTTYIDANAGGNSSVSYFYYVNARKGTLESVHSRCVGEFDKVLLNDPQPKGHAEQVSEIMDR